MSDASGSQTTGNGSDPLVDPQVTEKVLAAALAKGGDFAEVFAEERYSTGAVLDDGKVEELASARDRGAGIRVVIGDTTGFAHTADMSEAGLLKAAEAAAAVARDRSRTTVVPLVVEPVATQKLQVVQKSRKIELLARADEAARAVAGSVRQVSASYGDSHRRVLVATSDGLHVGDDQVRTRFAVSCVAIGDTGMQTGYETVANTLGFELFDDVDVEELARAAARRAVRKLEARPAPSGQLPIVLAPGSGGILFHEACGHGLEADHIV
jgi:TldD protein